MNVRYVSGTEAVIRGELHEFLSHTYQLSVLLPIGIGGVGLFLLTFVSPKHLPPLISAAAIAAILLGDIMIFIVCVQMWNVICMDMWFWIAYLYPCNLFLLSASCIRCHIQKQSELIRERNTQFRHKWVGKLYDYLKKASCFGTFSFLLIFPLAALLEFVLILCGQGANGVVKAFTQTADWTFSKQIPPPPLEYEGHYLCTVAAGGHKKLVRPERIGKRMGVVILVNRQLAVANAFEELLCEKMPRFHQSVRRFYDTHGYPLSRLITTPFRADAVYLMMKPLEWIFLFVLYMFDRNPEQRIAVQYPFDEVWNSKNLSS